MEFDREEVLEGKLSEASWSRVLSRYHDDTGEVELEPLHDVQAAMQSYVRAQVLADKVLYYLYNRMKGPRRRDFSK